MFKPYSPNYSLWPERARPGRRGIPLTLAAGSFAIGFVCATALYTIFTAFLGPADVPQAPAQRGVQDSPIIAPEVTPARSPAPVPPEKINHASRTPARPARVTLPIIGSQAALPSATDGRGGGDGEIAGGASATDVAASAGSSPDLMREEGDPALQPRAQEASSDGNEPGPATEPSAKPPPNKTVRKTRERTRSHADRSRRERSTTYAAARERQGPAYPTVSETASWY